MWKNVRVRTREVDTNPGEVLPISAAEGEVRLQNEVSQATGIKTYSEEPEVAARV
jgi:hypothetical protein